MGKNIIAVVAGYILWTVIFLGGSFVVRTARSAVHDENGFTSDTLTLIVYLTISCVASLAAGYLAAKITPQSRMLVAGILSVCLLATGIPVQLSAWNELPVWYNMIFLTLLVPVTFAGAAIAARGDQVKIA